MATPKLDLFDAPKVKVFRAVETILKLDPTLKRAIAPDQWQTWDGKPIPAAPSNSRASVWLTPAGQETAWYSPDSIAETLTIWVDLEVPSTNSDDIENLWYAIVRALYPRDDPALNPPQQARITIADQLRNAGGRTGVCSFQAPGAFDPQALATDGVLSARGAIRLDVIDTIDA